MTLQFNPRTRDFYGILDPAKAINTGLTLSTSATGPNGEPLYFTQSPYAALNFYRDADPAAIAQLNPLWDDYEASWAIESPNSYEMAGGIRLRPYQNAGIDYAVRKIAHTNGILIGDAPGIGKTYTALGFANHRKVKRGLVVCPATIRSQWRKDIKKVSLLEQVRVYQIERSSDGVANWPHWTIISYDLLRKPAIHAALCAMDWDIIILDEAHMLKEINARRTQALFGGGRREEFQDILASHARDMLALTGTPLPNRPRECYTLARALNWESIDFTSFESFRYRFNPSARMVNAEGKTYVREERGRLPELQARLRCNFMVRRLKEDVLKDLPDKTYEFAYIEEDGRIADVIRRERLLNYNIEDLKKPTFEIFGELSTIRREMGEAKVPKTLEHIRFLLETMEIPKVVLFSNHKSVMDALREGLKEFGVVEVRGGMGQKARDNSIAAFQHPEGPRIFSAQIEAGGVGIDGLQHICSHAVIVEPAWTSGINEQAIDRLHRLGQHGNVIAQFIVVEGSLDERILATVIDKTHVVHEALDNRKTRWI